MTKRRIPRPGTGVYKTYHMNSAIEALEIGNALGLPPRTFPEHYTWVGTFLSGCLHGARRVLTQYEHNPFLLYDGTQGLAHRDTMRGDVLIDPEGVPWMVDYKGFTQLDRSPTYRIMTRETTIQASEISIPPMFEVYHVNDPFAVGQYGELAGYQRQQFPEDYTHTATVPAHSLDEAFFRMQFDSMFEHEVYPPPYRSTSVGDVIRDHSGVNWIVEKTGFNRLEETTNRQIVTQRCERPDPEPFVPILPPKERER